MGVSDGRGVGVVIGVGDKVGVRVAVGVGVAGIVAVASGVEVAVVKRATRMVGLGVGVKRSETSSLNRQASTVRTHKENAKVIEFFGLKVCNPRVEIRAQRTLSFYASSKISLPGKVDL
jgi:hypothetical protein